MQLPSCLHGLEMVLLRSSSNVAQCILTCLGGSNSVIDTALLLGNQIKMN